MSFTLIWHNKKKKNLIKYLSALNVYKFRNFKNDSVKIKKLKISYLKNKFLRIFYIYRLIKKKKIIRSWMMKLNSSKLK